jgi:hypothetical protein
MAKRVSKSKKVTPPRGGKKSAPKSRKKSPSPKRVHIVDPFPGDDPFRL